MVRLVSELQEIHLKFPMIEANANSQNTWEAPEVPVHGSRLRLQGASGDWQAGSRGGCKAGSLGPGGGVKEQRSGSNLGSKIRKTGVTSSC